MKRPLLAPSVDFAQARLLRARALSPPLFMRLSLHPTMSCNPPFMPNAQELNCFERLPIEAAFLAPFLNAKVVLPVIGMNSPPAGVDPSRYNAPTLCCPMACPREEFSVSFYYDCPPLAYGF